MIANLLTVLICAPFIVAAIWGFTASDRVLVWQRHSRRPHHRMQSME